MLPISRKAASNKLGNMLGMLLAASALAPAPLAAAAPDGAGPYNARFLEGGIGLEHALPEDSPLLRTLAPFTMAAWVYPDRLQTGTLTLILLGDPAFTNCRALQLEDGRPVYKAGTETFAAPQALKSGRWNHVAVVSDGTTVRLFVDGKPAAQQAITTPRTAAMIALAPVREGQPHFAGALAGALADDSMLDPARLYAARPDFAAVQFRDVGVGWPFQRRANIGLTEQQEPWLLPQSATPPGAPASAPRAKPIKMQPVLAANGPGAWRLNGWMLAAAPMLGKADGAALSRPGSDTRGWYSATVPGTVLTTLVDRGVYPDPYYGLNNLAIPESLARQDYWYRTGFTVPPEAAGRALALRFDGINYAAEIWINGARTGEMQGAFTRGRFAFTPQAGENVVAVRISPPPHPGIPHEQSVKGGVGENGGQLAIDGPTFVAAEGWDWIPGVRDRNTGLWQGVTLEATGPVRIGDPHVITDLPLPRTDSADVTITVPLINIAEKPVALTLTANVGGIKVTRRVNAAPGTSTVTFSPATDPALRLANPRLWWPNGYGAPALYTLALTAESGGAVSDTKSLRFGVREVSYELSLFDSAGSLRRVEVDPTDARPGELPLIDVRHRAIKQTPLGWVQSLTLSGERSAAVRPTEQTFALPHLALRVNGVRIATRGGSWGMDDAMKRFGRAELEPYFRLEREAHMNVIRNWMGNNTEPAFYDLADENGMMILNDFWQSTQDFQIEPQDPQLFLANAADTIARYRNHPSIVLWFGRNEGVPYPVLNEGLDALVTRLDGTRWYTGSSNVVNLQGSGPYNYRPPAGYFTDLASGFSVETGTPSLATREAIEASVPAADRWPLGDTMAYHDWHFSGNGDTKTFMDTLNTMFGPAISLADFERKAQMLNLETHKAMMEGFVGHLWTKNSGRMFWMTHPSWPSNAWQLYSSDMDTHAAYYGARAGAEPVHIQLNLPDNQLMVINTTRGDLAGIKARVRITDLAGRTLLQLERQVNAPANAATPAGEVALAPLMAGGGMVLAALDLTDTKGAVLSRNFYWRGRDSAAYRELNTLAPASLSVQARLAAPEGNDRPITIDLANTGTGPGTGPALAIKLTVLDKAGARILPAFYEDNYVSLMPGERRALTVRVPAGSQPAAIGVRGWNIAERKVPIAK